jgi:hypothetical protein
VKRIALGIALFYAFAIQALSQTAGTGTIIRTATDPSGAVVPAAKIDLQDIATGVVRSSMTNSSGQDSFVGLQPGTYSVKASHAGFQELIGPQVAVEVGRSYTINLEFRIALQLKPGLQGLILKDSPSL